MKRTAPPARLGRGVALLAAFTASCGWYDEYQLARQHRTFRAMLEAGGALERVAGACGAYPVLPRDALGPDCARPGALMQQLVAGGYLATPVLCDGWERPLEYVAGSDLGAPELDAQRIPETCRTLFGERWTGEYVLYSRGRDGAIDCGVPAWQPDEQRFVTAGPQGRCRSGCGFYDPHDYDCDMVVGSEGAVTAPRGGIGQD